MLRPTHEELEAVEKEYKEENRWLPDDDPLGYLLRCKINEYTYNILKDKLPEAVIEILKADNIYKYNEIHSIGCLSHAFAGYVQITENRIKELEDKLAKLENQVNIRK